MAPALQFVVILILIGFLAYVFMAFGLVNFLLNLAIAVILYFLIKRDLKDHSSHKYYLGGLVLTALFFILSTTNVFAFVLLLIAKWGISVINLALFLLYGFSQVVGLAYPLIFKEKHGKKQHH